MSVAAYTTERLRADAQHWRERHCAEAAAAGEQSQKNWSRAKSLESALGLIAELGDRCEDCEPTEAPFATHMARDASFSIHGIEHYFCDACAENARAAYRKAESKGCGRQPEVELYEQETPVRIALEALNPRIAKDQVT